MVTVIERLLHEEDKMKNKDLATSSEEALIAKYRKKGQRHHFCNKFRHIQRNCRERERLSSRGMPRTDQYPQRTDNSVNSAEIKRHCYDADSEEEVDLVFQHAFSAGATNGLQQNSKWIVDSGASCHVCNDRGLFVIFKNL